MGKDLHIIDQIFLKAVEPYEENPPDGTWKAIENKLDGRNTGGSKRKFYIFRIAAALVILLLLGLGIYKIKKIGHANHSPAGKNISLSKPSVNLPPGKNPITLKEVPIPQFKSPAVKKEYEKGPQNNLQDTHQASQGEPKYAFSWKRHSIISDLSGPIKNRIFQLQPIMARPVPLKNKLNNIIPLRLEAPKPPFFAIEGMENKNHLNESYPDSINYNRSLKKKSTQKDWLSRISLSIMFSPDINGYNLKNNGAANNQQAGEFRNNEQEGFAYTGGVMMDYAVNNKWTLESGITLTNTMLSIYPSTIYAQKDNNGNVDYILPTSTGYSKIPDASNSNLQVGDSLELTSNSTQRLRYISLPFILKYHFKKGRFTLQGYSGLGINFLSKSTTEVTFQTGNVQFNEAIDTIQGLKGTYLSGLVGIGVQYDLTKRVKISLSPTLKYSITSINENTPFKKYPYSIGVWTGITYQF